jgi:glycosyltransferase involved in cell wall biosynthesis
MRVDIVIPAHNEQERIGPMLDAYLTRCAGPEMRFLVALDRCTDRTAEVVGARAERDPRVVAVDYPKLGKGGVLMETFRRCDADLVGFVDADGATPPSEMLRLIDAARDRDGAIASRRHPASVLPARRGLAREVTSAGFAFWVRRLFRLPYTDTQCGAKVFRREAMERMLPLLTSRDFLLDVDLLLVARRLGYRIETVPTIWIDREGSRLRAATDAKRMAFSTLRLWLQHRTVPIETEGGERDASAVAARPSEADVTDGAGATDGASAGADRGPTATGSDTSEPDTSEEDRHAAA